MTDIDQLSRAVKDLEYRVKLLEKAASVTAQTVAHGARRDDYAKKMGQLWCSCGRDICRAPDCPSHKTDPLGR